MNCFSGRNFLVIGGAGFIGSHTVDSLIKLGAKVSIVDNFSTGKKEYCNPAAALYEMDAAGPGLSGVFEAEKPSVVMTFASVVDIPIAIQQPMLTCNGISATVNALECSVKHNVQKFLYASSGFIYGNSPTLPITEDQPCIPLNPYNIAKATGEHYCSFFSEKYNLSCVSMRYAPVYGPRRTIGPILDYIRCISNGRSSEIYGNKTRDYIYVDDVVLANLLAVEYQGKYGVFNIGTEVESTLESIYIYIAHRLNVPNNLPILCKTKSNEVERFKLDISKAKRELGFSPRVDLMEGLNKTIDWVLEQNL